MKFLVVFACALAAVSAGFVAPVATVYGAQHVPVINHEGVPVDTAEVQHAKAVHFAHKVNAAARNGDAAVVAPVVAAHAPVVAAAYAAPFYHHAYPTTVVAPTSVNGVPAETPEVVAAKANHFAAHAEALARTAFPVVYRHRRGIYAPAPVAYSAAYTTPFVSAYAAPFYNHAYPTTAVAPTSVNGVPLETPEVVAAKVNHFAAHSEALARTGHPAAVLYRHRRGIYTPAPVAYSAAYTTPVVASTYKYAAPVVATTYAHAAPVSHATYAHYY